MTIIDTTLYANGALRLSRHGAGRGGTVLIYVRPDTGTRQFKVGDDVTPALVSRLNAMIACNYEPIVAFNALLEEFAGSAPRT